MTVRQTANEVIVWMVSEALHKTLRDFADIYGNPGLTESAVNLHSTKSNIQGQLYKGNIVK